MDKAIIYNVYDFVSFHLCKALLEKGVEVKGVYFDAPDEPFLEEKQLEVGRNANFEAQNGQKFNVNNKRTNTIVISIYDLYMLHKISLLEKDLFKATAENHLEDVIIILPDQMIADRSDDKDIQRIKAYLKLIRKNADHVYMFYLPTVYGPWQPATFLFQQTILNQINKAEAFKEIRESTCDCLYIDDAVRTMLLIKKSKKPGKYLIHSGLNNYWRQCAEYLHVKQIPELFDERFDRNDEFEKITVKDLSPIAESITSQVKHAERLNLSKDGLGEGRI